MVLRIKDKNITGFSRVWNKIFKICENTVKKVYRHIVIWCYKKNHFMIKVGSKAANQTFTASSMSYVWKRAELITSFLALKTSYCVRNPRSQHLMIDDLISIIRGSPFLLCMFSFEIRTVPETDPSSRFAQWKLLGKANSSSLVSHMSMTTSFTTSLIKIL